MIEDLRSLATNVTLGGELAIVGAGPAGIVTALEAARRGIEVLLIESGNRSFHSAVQRLSDAAEWDRDRHAPMSLASRRQVGGTSVIWGGRCVPYDPVDFQSRPFISSLSWPVSYEEMRGYFQRACDWLVCGRAIFSALEIPNLTGSIVPGLVDGHVTSSTLERWSLPTNFGTAYLAHLRRTPNVRLITGLTCTKVVCHRESRGAEYLECRTMTGMRVRVNAKAFVIACGGLESTRLLMASSGPEGGQLGNDSGHLGRWYMAHVEGAVANVHFSTPPRATVYGYERDIDGVYVRRRLAFTDTFQRAHELPNVVAWLGNPELPDARHKSGPLSMAYLALSSPLGRRLAPDAQRLSLTGKDIPGTPYGGAAISPRRSHARNVVREPLLTAQFVVGFGTQRFLRPGRRPPGFFVYSNENVYPLQYHGEHRPNWSSRITLAREVDDLGMQKLNIKLRYSRGDVDGLVRAHEHWDAYLRSSRVGWLDYPHGDLYAAVERRLGGGFHQCGTTRMSATPADGVVDTNLALHGVGNLYVASSSTFVTSGQANSTFMVVAFALRLADHLGRRLRA
jgi:hypothetical protein